MPKLALLAGLLAIVTLAACAAPTSTPTPTPTRTATPSPTRTPTPTGGPEIKRYSSPPAMTIDANKRYVATLETSLGDIVVEMLPKEAPRTVNNFVFLARVGFYDGTRLHRVIKGFMLQGGDPLGNGTGGPG
ncbi:MAG: peptidylprolyl isomerase, partial [Chloroflexota bacterium]|nr:peptidylprolyl isomerase [Chloroflexota bacterium]